MANTPHVVCYRTDAVSYAIARRVMRCRHIGLVNLVAQREVVPEYVQGEMTPEVLAVEVSRLLDPNSAGVAKQREGFAEVCNSLGQPGAAMRVAALAKELLA